MIQLYSKYVKTALGVGMPTMCTYMYINNKSIMSRGGRAQLFLCPQPQFYHLKAALLQLRIRNFERNVIRNCISAFCNHNFFLAIHTQEAKYVEGWPNTTSAWAGWSRFDIPVDRYGGVHSLLRWPSRTLGSLTCH
jgi:hypothetical protein